MKKTFLFLTAFFCIATLSLAQTAINTDGSAPDANTMLHVKHTSTSGSIFAIQGVISSTTPGGFSAGIRGINNGTGGLGIGVYGSQNGSGWGVYGTTPNGIGVYGNATNSGFGVYGGSSTGTGVYGISSTGEAGRFEINNSGGTSNALTGLTLGTGRSILGIRGGGSGITLGTTESIRGDNTDGPGVAGTSSSFSGVYGTSVTSHGMWGVSIASGMAGVQGRNDIVGGYGIWGTSSGGGIGVYGTSQTGTAGQFDIINTSSTADAVIVNQKGTGRGIYSLINQSSNTLPALRGETNGSGYGVYGLATGLGTAGFFQISNPSSTNTAVNVSHNGFGSGVSISLTNTSNGGRGVDVNQMGVGPGVFSTSAGGNAVWGITSSTSAAGVIGDNTNGESVVGRSRVLISGAVVGRNDGSYDPINGTGSTSHPSGVRGFVTGFGSYGVLGQAGISSSSNVAGRFENFSGTNTQTVLEVNTQSVFNNLATFQNSGTNVARIGNNGAGFFNGGTFNSGADVAEMFDINGNKTEYEPGDVLSISTTSDRTVEKSSGPYSTLVAGVYATKPGVTLTEDHIDASQDTKVPMGVIGVIPTKVCTEGGEIKRGDLLVTSSIPGVAMKGDMDKIKPGQVIGKALQDYSAKEVGKIKVLVSIK